MDEDKRNEAEQQDTADEQLAEVDEQVVEPDEPQDAAVEQTEPEQPAAAADNKRDLSSTAELLSNIDEAVAEYSFSIDDILAEFGVKREEDVELPPPSVEPPQPIQAEEDDYDEQPDALAEKLGSVMEEMRSEQEEEKLREIERNVLKVAEEEASTPPEEFPASPDQVDEDGKVTLFEDTESEEEPKKHRFFHRKKNEPERPDPQKLFGGSLDDVFKNDNARDPSKRDGGTSESDFEEELEREPKRKRRRKAKTEEELEREIFAENGEGGEKVIEPEATPEEEANAIVARLGRSRLRLIGGALCALALLVIMIAPHIGLPMPTFLTYIKSPYIYLFVCCALEIAAMLLCFEITTIGVRDLVTLRPNMESVVVFANLASLAHMIVVMLKPEWEGYYGYSAVSTTALVLSAYYLRKLELAKLKSCRAAAGMSHPYAVVAEPDIYDGETALVKYRANEPLGFVTRLNRDDYTRRVWRVVSPIVICASIALAAVASFGTGVGHRFFWCLAAITAASAPLGIMLPYCLCFAKAARHLYGMGEALAGYSAAESLSGAESIVVTDGDIFPRGNISLSGLKVYGGNTVDKVISYAASLINASGAATARPFAEQLNNQSGELLKVESFKFYENGGIGGEIQGHVVLAGTASFMMRNGIRIPQDVGGKTLIFVAINLEIAGVFALNYTASPAVRSGLSMLLHHKLTPVFATRDFNISPSMIETKFKLSTDTIDFPKESERLELSNPNHLFTGRISAVISREGLKHYAECVVCARNLVKSVQITTGITLAGVILAMLVMFYLCFTGAAVVASPLNLLIFALFWFVPNLIVSRWVSA